jgi:hypothetical protein
MFTDRFTASEVMSMIVAAPPGTSVRYVMDEGYSITDHLLATMSEQQAGLVTLQTRYSRPGVQVSEEPKSGRKSFGSIADFEKYRAKMMVPDG